MKKILKDTVDIIQKTYIEQWYKNIEQYNDNWKERKREGTLEDREWTVGSELSKSSSLGPGPSSGQSVPTGTNLLSNIFWLSRRYQDLTVLNWSLLVLIR